MSMWATLSMLYLIGNSLAGIYMIIAIFSTITEDDYSSLLFYPLVHEYFDNINLAGKIIAYTFITIALLPALIMFYSAVALMFLIRVVCVLFCEIFKKR